jgi:nitrogen fixation/metabolism regulation signal transduction histidine kinase
VKLFTNPVFLRMVAVFLAGAFAFFVGVVLMKKIKRRLQEDQGLAEGNPAADSFPLHTYHAVIQQLKQQKHELQALQQAERRRSRTTESLSAAVLSNLSSGVLFFNTAGLVRQANSAAKSILGFAAPAGMNAHDLFRSATLEGKKELGISTAAEAVSSTLKHATVFRRLEIDYVTPAGQRRVLDLTVSPVYAADAQLLGASCVIQDQTEVVEMRRSQILRGEMSAEMALELKNSLATISGYARHLVNNYDHDTAEQLAVDIAAEAGHLERKIGGFLSGAKAAAKASGVN